ncbi:Tat pathway signal sequence domain protein [Streptomyces dangxiongensis]|uniref:Tat pathway signal sequence domain protein n=1 Tax=Streptomyces dangxiongensis TaxID=1442032 RepID=A0A3G2JB81_9ACTN|nr:Tat pathway signal sequence domain protein [Streptomyces dangxiongensis]AYN37782.1 Tat pathway signal sequence domain protein [Streptomyces dangxiongensis]
MRRTVLSATALACTTVLAAIVPAFADGTKPTHAPAPAPSKVATSVPSAPAQGSTKDSRTPGTEPTQAPARDQVDKVPAGAPDTGVITPAADSHSQNGLIGGAAGAALVLAGGAAFVVRRRATGA